MAGRRFFLILCISIFGLSAQAVAASFPLIVQIPPAASITPIAITLGGTVVDSIPGADTYLVNVPFLPSPGTMSLLGIQWMELNKSVTLPRFGIRGVVQVPASTAADWYKNQPSMQLIKAGSARSYSTGSGVVVADINSNLDYAHPALVGHLTSGYDFVATRPPGSPFLDQADAGFMDQADAGFMDQADAGFMDQADAGFMDLSNPILASLTPSYTHGTASAGIIAAIAPGSMIMPLRAFDDDGHTDLFTLAKAIRFAVDHGAQVINLIFGSFTPSLAINKAVQFAEASNVLLVAAAGNGKTSQPEYPSAFTGVLAVAATDLSDTKGYFSSYGSHVFVTAPGVDIFSAYPLGYYSIVSGTSFSAAAVAATAAVVRSMRTTGVADSIAGGSVNIDGQNPIYAQQLGTGRIDVLSAALAGTPAITTVNPSTGEQGRNLTISVTGRSTHFDQATTQLSLGADLTITNVVVANPTSLTARLNIAGNATPGTRTLTVTTSAEVATLDIALTVAPGNAALASVDPVSARQGDSVTVNITGQFTSFVQGTTQVSLGDGVTVNSVSVSNSTGLTAQASALPTAAIGPRKVTVTTGAQVVTLNNSFTVTAGPPGITAATPNSGQQGQSVTLAVTGQFTHFAQSTTQVSIDGISVDSVTVTDATALTAHLTIPAAAVVGSRTLTVTTGSETATLSNAFSVTPGTPVIAAVSPTTGKQADTATASVTGQFTHFVQGTTQVDFGPGFSVTALTVNSATNLSAQLAISSTAAVGSRRVTVTTAAEVVTLDNAFTVAPGTPAITTVNPSAGHQGQNLAVTVTGLFTGFVQGSTQVTFGADVTVVNVTVASATSLTAQLEIANIAATGSRTLMVTTGSEAVTLNNAFTVTSGLPVLTIATPNSGQQGQNVTLAVTGQFTHFAQGTTQVSIDGVTVSSVTVTDPTSLTAHLTVPATAAVGSRTLTVTTGGEAPTLSNAFNVTPGTPVITAVSPNTGKQGDTVTVAVTGQFTHFAQGATQVDFGPGLSITALTVHSATSLSAQASISSTAPVGARHLTVTTSAEAVTLDNGFTVAPGTPVITTANPNAGQQGQNLVVTVTGQFTGFVQGSTQVSFGADVTVVNVTVASPASLTAQLEVGGAAVGPRALTVTTGAEVVTLNNGFTVTARPALITTVTPNNGQQGQTVTLAVTGQFTHFAQGATQVSIDGITVNSVTVTDPTSLTAHLTIPATAAVGSRTLTVTTGTEAATLSNAFGVTPGTPVITAVNPNTGKQGDTLTVAVTGQFTHFAQGATQVDFGPGLSITAVTVHSATSLSAQLAISSTAAVGSRHVTVTTAAEVVSLANAFAVAPGTPVITTANPNAGQQGQNLAVIVTGQFTSFVQGSTQVSFGAEVTVVNVTVASPTSLIAQLEVGGIAAVGPRTLTVTTGAEVVTLNNGFTVTARPAVITTVTPNNGQQGQTVTLAVTGEFTHFAQGVTQVNIDGITVNSVTVTGATLLTASLTVPAAAAVGSRMLTVITGTELATLSNAFTVTPGIAVITAASPSAGKQGDTVTVAITGQFTHFAQGTTQVDFGPGVSVTALAVNSATSMMAQLTISSTATVGSRQGAVTTGAEAVTLNNPFSVTPGRPIITTAMPNSGQQGQNVALTVTGQFTHFFQGLTQVRIDGITVNSVIVTNATLLTAYLTIPAAAAVGSRTLIVTMGPELAALSNAFSVTPGTPEIMAISPNTGKQVDTVTVAITGQFTHFAPGITQVDFGPGFSVTGLTVNSATSLLVQLSISNVAPVGSTHVTVTTAGEVVTLNNGFLVTPQILGLN